jgi:hypothetical protein
MPPPAEPCEVMAGRRASACRVIASAWPGTRTGVSATKPFSALRHYPFVRLKAAASRSASCAPLAMSAGR